MKNEIKNLSTEEMKEKLNKRWNKTGSNSMGAYFYDEPEFQDETYNIKVTIRNNILNLVAPIVYDEKSFNKISMSSKVVFFKSFVSLYSAFRPMYAQFIIDELFSN